MSLLTTRPEHARELAALLERPGALVVVCLCAAWCDVCRGFQPDFSRIDEQHPGAGLVWVDVEDDSEIAGDIDVDNFPTIAVFRDGRPLLFGVVLPQAGSIARVLDSFDAEARPVSVPEAVARLPALLAGHARSVAGTA